MTPSFELGEILVTNLNPDKFRPRRHALKLPPQLRRDFRRKKNDPQPTLVMMGTKRSQCSRCVRRIVCIKSERNIDTFR